MHRRCDERQACDDFTPRVPNRGGDRGHFVAQSSNEDVQSSNEDVIAGCAHAGQPQREQSAIAHRHRSTLESAQAPVQHFRG
jgi:hypothetical protein